jgi:1-acyl-sn-glycerol-3-phosphate acyltransferase
METKVGTLVIAAPHLSRLDGFVVSRFLHRHLPGPATFAVLSADARHPVYKHILGVWGRMYGHSLLPLSKAQPFAVRRLAELLRSGETVVLFPQGAALSDRERAWRRGQAWLQEKTGCPVLRLVVDHGTVMVPRCFKEHTGEG